jgi:hypothetical protein
MTLLGNKRGQKLSRRALSMTTRVVAASLPPLSSFPLPHPSLDIQLELAAPS